jgi:hypothetical protein
VVIDAVVPVLLLYAHQSGAAELRDALLACYHAAPRLPDNTLLRDMTRRLLGDDPALRALVAGARQQQGLLQVFDEFCRHDEEECQACTFSILPDAWETDATSLSDDHGWT